MCHVRIPRRNHVDHLYRASSSSIHQPPLEVRAFVKSVSKIMSEKGGGAILGIG